MRTAAQLLVPASLDLISSATWIAIPRPRRMGVMNRLDRDSPSILSG